VPGPAEVTVQSVPESDVDLRGSLAAQVAADQVWRQGITGRGVTVAALDTGLLLPGPDGALPGDGHDFTGRVLAAVAVGSTAGDPFDRLGHGTHVAGVAAGDGRKSGGRHSGIAPGANLVSVKFTDDQGRSAEADLAAALRWVLENRQRYNIRVLNLSSSLNRQASWRDGSVGPLLQQLWAAGVVVVVAAGNRGGQPCGICYTPANVPSVITVGALDAAGKAPAPFSSRGVTQDGLVKPDLYAPGTGVVGPLPGPDARLARLYPRSVVDRSYIRLNGTSHAAPVVAGAAALMLEANPRLTPDQVKAILLGTARPGGVLNLPAAVAAARAMGG
jgi:serine protease AprX